jgi:DNA-binding MurR/RpiR family transcriptional regulator
MRERYGEAAMDVEQRLLERADTLTPTERRIAEVVLERPQIVGFGTVADLAAAADSGTATVVRFAVKLGYQGFAELQASVQNDLAGQLRPAAERIRDPHRPFDDHTAIRRHAETELGNVRATLDAADAGAVIDVVERLADERFAVLVLSGAASRGVAQQFVDDLDQLRSGCSLLDGNHVDVVRSLALAGPDCTLLVLDLRRYERWLLDAVDVARDSGAWIVALTDSVLSPLASSAGRAFVLSAASTGPFDSHVGTLALLNLLVLDVAVARRDAATDRLDRLEAAWRAADALTD